MKTLIACLILALAIAMAHACSSCHKNHRSHGGLRSRLLFHDGYSGSRSRRHDGWGGWGNWGGHDDCGGWGDHDDCSHRRSHFNYRLPRSSWNDRHSDSWCDRRCHHGGPRCFPWLN